jgi:hypothetical protein
MASLTVYEVGMDNYQNEEFKTYHEGDGVFGLLRDAHGHSDGIIVNVL